MWGVVVLVWIFPRRGQREYMLIEGVVYSDGDAKGVRSADEPGAG